MERLPSRKRQHNQQGGYTLLQVILGLAIASLIFVLAIPIVQQQQLDIRRVASAAHANEIAQAAKTWYVEAFENTTASLSSAATPAYTNTRPVCTSAATGTPTTLDPDLCWPPTLASLSTPPSPVTRTYLAGTRHAISGYGTSVTYARNGATMTVTIETPSAGEATLLGSHFGALATITGTQVAITWAAPGIDAEHRALLDLRGTREMVGTITFNTTAIANNIAIAANDGHINDPGNITNANQVNADYVGATRAHFSGDKATNNTPDTNFGTGVSGIVFAAGGNVIGSAASNPIGADVTVIQASGNLVSPSAFVQTLRAVGNSDLARTDIEELRIQ